MEYKYSELMKVINKGMKPFVMYKISKEEIETGDMKGLDKFFKTILRVGSPLRQSCSIICGGYDDIPDELYEIPEVVKFVKKMFRRFPYILYYISTETESDHWLISSMADSLTSKADIEIKKMNANQVFEKYGFDTPRVEAMLVFEGDNLSNIIKPILDHGKKIGDVENARKIAIDYAMRFDNWERTLEQLGAEKWNRR